MKKLGFVLLIFAAVWAAAAAGLAIAMRQPPATFGRIMSHVPGPAFMLLPFETLWMHARGGSLEPGDPAPDFSLATLNRQSRVRLSDLRGRPVVLVFGSYT